MSLTRSVARVREQAQKELFGHFDQLGGAPPVIDLNAITAALRPDTAVCVVVVAEHDAHAVIVGRASDGAPHTHSLRLTGFNRTLVDSLLLNVDAQPKGLLDAIARLQVLGPHPDEASFSNAVALFSNLLKQCEGSLASILIDPIFSALERGFGERVTRICWSVPPCMWPLPLHAFPTAEPSRPRIQTYGRSINEIASLSRRVADGRRPIRRVLAVDDPCDDMQAKSPFLKRARDTIWTEIKRATPRKILRGLESADTLLFHGHGCWNIGDPDRSGLIVLRSSSGSEPGVLPFTTLRRLRERPPDVAVLSACDVGAIELFAGADDFEGMPSELLDAGFSCVVAATWPVHQDATAELMNEFMSQMFEERLDPAAALAAAQTVRNTIGPSFAMQRAASDISSSSESVRPAKFHVDPNSAFWWAGFCVVGL